VDGIAVEGLLPGIPTRDSVGIRVPASKSAGVRVELRGEVIHARPAEAENDLNVVELIWD
jgi:hypothetical protein